MEKRRYRKQICAICHKGRDAGGPATFYIRGYKFVVFICNDCYEEAKARGGPEKP